MLEFVEDHCKNNGISRIHLSSGFETPGAHKFYIKSGYKKYGAAFKKKLN